MVNTHGTRLPLGRGEPMSWRVLKEDRLDNQLLAKDKIDFGPIIFNKLTVIPKNFSYLQRYNNLDIKILLIFISFISNIKKTKIFMKHPPEYFSSYLPRLSTDKNGWIDWSLDPHELIRFINAFDEPYVEPAH